MLWQPDLILFCIHSFTSSQCFISCRKHLSLSSSGGLLNCPSALLKFYKQSAENIDGHEFKWANLYKTRKNPIKSTKNQILQPCFTLTDYHNYWMNERFFWFLIFFIAQVSLFYVFLKLVQINFIFSDNVHSFCILYIFTLVMTLTHYN